MRESLMGPVAFVSNGVVAERVGRSPVEDSGIPVFTNNVVTSVVAEPEVQGDNTSEDIIVEADHPLIALLRSGVYRPADLDPRLSDCNVGFVVGCSEYPVALGKIPGTNRYVGVGKEVNHGFWIPSLEDRIIIHIGVNGTLFDTVKNWVDRQNNQGAIDPHDHSSIEEAPTSRSWIGMITRLPVVSRFFR